jgi:hypothetical protein
MAGADRRTTEFVRNRAFPKFNPQSVLPAPAQERRGRRRYRS